MDGKSILKLISGTKGHLRDGVDPSSYTKRRPWRDSFLVESSGRQNAGVVKNTKPKKMHWKKNQPFLPRPALTKAQHLSEICEGPDYKSPCKLNQKWECVFHQKWRIQKCRHKKWKRKKGNCICFEDSLSSQLDPIEQKRQREFLRDHVSRGDDFKRFTGGSRGKRSYDSTFDVDSVLQLHEILQLQHQYPDLLEVVDNSSFTRSTRQLALRSIKQFPPPNIGCRITQNNIINCSQEVYRDRTAWRMNKNNIDTQIKELKEKLGELKDIRKHLKQKRPGEVFNVPRRRRPHFGTFDPIDDYISSEIDGEQFPKVFEPSPDEEETGGGAGEVDGTIIDADGIGRTVDEDGCVCENKGKSFAKGGRFGGGGRGSRKDEIQEEKRRLKEERLRRKEERMKHYDKKSRRVEKYQNYTCNIEKMNCFVHNNDHWKTPPLWTDGPFCFCQNSNNNTYWCVRTINETHDFLFCEFITGFLSFFDMKTDPYQLHNIVREVPFPTLSQLHLQLMKLKECRGAKDCNMRTRLKARDVVGGEGISDRDLESTPQPTTNDPHDLPDDVTESLETGSGSFSIDNQFNDDDDEDY